MDIVGLYRIGSNWLFDINNKRGFKVTFNKKGKEEYSVNEIIEAFELKDSYESEKKIKDIPLGVIRRAKHIVELDNKGLIDNKVRIASGIN